MAALSLAVLGLAPLTSACAGLTRDASASAGGAAAGSAAATSTAGPTPEITEKPTVVIPKPADPLAGKYIAVKRNGKVPTPTITAAAGSFTKPVRYSDGVTLQVVSIRQGVVTGKGPGIFPGQPTTTVGLRLTNGTSKAIALNQVVVTATYGSPKRVAPPVYDSLASDFGGTASPGASVDATYVFSIPTADLGNVVIFVDFDSSHVSAIVAGAAR